MRKPSLLACAASVVALTADILAAGSAFAHALSPSMLTVRELAGGDVEVAWKTPLMKLPGSELRPMLPKDCTVSAPPELHEESDSVTARWSMVCGEHGLVGREIAVEGLGYARTDALLHIELADGRVVDTVLRAREPRFVVPDHESVLTVIRRYGELGVEHIVTGWDHLLFALGLLLLARDRRALLATITAFTVGHSLTLTLAALDLAHVPPSPIEVLIAFSIFVLAVELARSDASSRVWRKPWTMALLFGLLHGLGFAGALRAAGLPAGSIPLALFSFNVGIELGQLGFVGTVVAVYGAARSLAVPAPSWGRTLIVYAIGSLGVFWMIERTLPLISS